MIKQNRLFVIIFLIFGFLSPHVVLALKLNTTKTDISCCGNIKSKLSSKKNCCKNKNSKNGKKTCNCNGKCSKASCLCPIATIPFFVLQSNLEAHFEIPSVTAANQFFAQHESQISSGFRSIWLIPKIV